MDRMMDRAFNEALSKKNLEEVSLIAIHLECTPGKLQLSARNCFVAFYLSSFVRPSAQVHSSEGVDMWMTAAQQS